jgi:uncharacterized protein (TIGR03118 family)
MPADLLSTRSRRLALLTVLALLLLVLPGTAFAHGNTGSHGFYQQMNLVSDTPGLARFTDSNLVNPWGLSHSPTSPWWISDNGTGVSTLYRGDGTAVPLVVTIPPPAGSASGTTAAPTGNIFNPVNSTDPDDFVVSQNGKSAPSIFIFATEDGTISGWNPNVNTNHAIREVDRSAVGAGAVYKGLAFGSSDGSEFLYATNFRFGTVEMFDANFHLVRSFTDAKRANDCPLPNQCYAPFGIQNIGGKLYVTFALQDAAHHDDMAGAGHGFVDVFDTEGHLLRRLISRGHLNSPWGLAHAPSNFGRFSNALLVGNFGDGFINAYSQRTGEFLGQLKNSSGNAIQIDGLWGLAFGNGAAAGETDELFFTAGIGDEQHGLFGKIESEG